VLAGKDVYSPGSNTGNHARSGLLVYCLCSTEGSEAGKCRWCMWDAGIASGHAAKQDPGIRRTLLCLGLVVYTRPQAHRQHSQA
jgi:hypothetical protein